MANRKPNILVFMTDQQRGASVLADHPAKTPIIDRLKRDSVTFTNAYCPSPHCCPSRATFLTGLYPTEHGVWHNVSVQNAITRGLAPGVRLWSEDLADAGYDLHWSGKWHVSFDEGPADRGWREWSVTAGPQREPGTFMGTTWDGYRELARGETGTTRGDGQIVRPGYGTYTHYGVNENPFRDQDQVDAAIRALESIGADRAAPDAPWMLYVGTLGPHDPYVVPQRFLDMYDIDDIELPPSFDDRMADKPALYRKTRDRFDQLTPEEHRKALLHYYAFCSYEDYLFGQVLDALDRSGEAVNTIVVYCSDHGDYTADHGLWCKGLPCFRGAYHVPAIVRWPGRIADPGRTVAAPVSLADFGPTFLDAAGVASAGAIRAGATMRPMSGMSLMPFLTGSGPSSWRTEMYTQTNGNELYGIQRAVFNNEWKYVYNGFDYEELYDLQSDPEETVNLFGRPEHDAVVREMSAKLWRFAYDHDDTCINPYVMVALAPYGPAAAFG